MSWRVLILFLSVSLAISGNAQDYVSAAGDTSRRDPLNGCEKFVAKSIRRIEGHTKRLKKTNDAFLRKFEKAENGVCMQLCKLNEQHAESMIRSSLYAYRAFESSLERGTGRPAAANEHDRMLEDIRTFSQTSPGSKNKCSCADWSGLKTARENLEKEKRRTAMVGRYIRGRTEYLNALSAEYPALKGPLIPLKKVSFYYESRIKEWSGLFTQLSGSELSFLNNLTQNAEFRQFLSGNIAQPAIQSPAPASHQLTDVAMSAFKERAESLGVNATELLNPIKDAGKSLQDDNRLNELKSTAAQTSETLSAEASDAIEGAQPDSVSTPENKEDWKPNQAQTKRLRDRFNMTFNLQADRRTLFLPTSGMVSSELNFMLHQNAFIGAGFGCRAAFSLISSGSDDRRRIHSAFGGWNYRLLAGYRIKGPLYFQTNAEWNDHPITIDERAGVNPEALQWLAGFRIAPGGGGRTQNNLSILYNFMHARSGQPAIVVRAGITIKPRNGLKL
jgi:hypothetical protein